MIKAKAKKILDILDHYFPEPPIPLTHKDPYTLLIAVLLSAQCTDERVNQVTPFLFKKADSPEKMMQLSWQEIQSIIRPCGLSEKKAKAIFSLSKILVEKYDAKVPKTFDTLESLPGIGHKSASVIMIQCFNIPAFPVDTHIYRLARRWKISDKKSIAGVEKDLKAFFPKKCWIRLHLQMIYFGRTFCPAKGHVIDTCPICKWAA